MEIKGLTVRACFDHTNKFQRDKGVDRSRQSNAQIRKPQQQKRRKIIGMTVHGQHLKTD